MGLDLKEATAFTARNAGFVRGISDWGDWEMAAGIAAERFTITGDLDFAAFVPWIERHARRLGLSLRVTAMSPTVVTVQIEGPPDLVDAMEMGCLLGPIEVWVEGIERENARGSTEH